MKKAKNILLLTGICLYIVNAVSVFLVTLPKLKPLSASMAQNMIKNLLISDLEVLVFLALSIVLFCLNLKNIHSKVFAIIVTVLNALSCVLMSIAVIDLHYFYVLQYSILSAIGIKDTVAGEWLVSLFVPHIRLFNAVSLISLIVITLGAIFSINKPKIKNN